MEKKKNWTDNIRVAKKGRVRHGSVGNIEELWKRKREEFEGDDCFNKSKKP